MLRVGLIGCGGIGAVHAVCWQQMDERVQLVAIADMNTVRAEEFAVKSGAKVYADANEMLASETLDVVDICLPTFLHAEYMCKAMHRVKNVIVEKPVCLTEEEAAQILQVEAETGALVQVAHVSRFGDSSAYLKKLVESGEYGKVIAGNFWRISPRPVWLRGHDDIRVSGTMALDFHIHDVDYVRWLMGGDPEQLQTWAVKDGAGVVQHIWTSYQYGDARLVAEGSWDYPTCLPFSRTFRVRLEKAAVVLDAQGVLTVYPENGEAFTPPMEPKIKMDMGINVSDLGVYLKELNCFVDAITAGAGAAVSLSEAVAAFRLARKELEMNL